MKRCFALALILVFIAACGTKRQYFKPESTLASLSYDERLGSYITDTNLYFARLKNLQVLGKQGVLEDFKLEKGYTLLKAEHGEFVIADENGNLKILSGGEEVYTHKFEAAVLGVDLDGDDLALILADNTLVVANRSLGIKMQQSLSEALAQDSRVAAPLFMAQSIVFPTLDGKIMIIDRASLKTLQDIIISSEDFFNNVIFMQIVGDRLIAATAKSILSFRANEPKKSLNAEIKGVHVHEGAIFILTKEGTLIRTDLNLNKLAEKKLAFAIFNESGIFNQHLYVFEKTGYWIKVDLNLENVEVYRLTGAVDEKSFMGEDKFYYDNKILNLK